MSQEQLANWLCCAFLYAEKSGDRKWLEDKNDVLLACFESMVNRDHPQEEKRNGVMGLDSSRTKGGVGDHHLRQPGRFPGAGAKQHLSGGKVLAIRYIYWRPM